MLKRIKEFFENVTVVDVIDTLNVVLRIIGIIIMLIITYLNVRYQAGIIPRVIIMR